MVNKFRNIILIYVNDTLCNIGLHKWVNIDRHTPIPTDGERIYFSNLHECSHCKKKEYKPMGSII